MIKRLIASAKKNEFVQGRMIKLSIIKKERSPTKKVLKYCWYWATILPVFIWENRHDKELMIGTLISFIILGASVWVPGMIAFIKGGWQAMIIAISGPLLLWNAPFTPFLLLVLGFGIANKALYRKFIKPIKFVDTFNRNVYNNYR